CWEDMMTTGIEKSSDTGKNLAKHLEAILDGTTHTTPKDLDDIEWPTAEDLQQQARFDAVLEALESEPVRLTLFGDGAATTELDNILHDIFTLAEAADDGEVLPFVLTNEDEEEWHHFHVAINDDGQFAIEYLLPKGYTLGDGPTQLEVVSADDERSLEVNARSEGDYVYVEAGDARLLRKRFQSVCGELGIANAFDVMIFVAIPLTRIEE
ncbi:MAG: hypothetical protein ACNA8W_23445, partial [Bradymonadaceae bacterium]